MLDFFGNFYCVDVQLNEQARRCAVKGRLLILTYGILLSEEAGFSTRESKPKF